MKLTVLRKFSTLVKPIVDESCHVPVMTAEVLAALRLSPGSLCLDMTFGGGGHSRALLATGCVDCLWTLDRDISAVQRAHQLASFYPRNLVRPLHGCFSQAANLIQKDASNAQLQLDAILLDAGFSTDQMSCPKRGFSLLLDSPLDMRMDCTNDAPNAEDVLRILCARDLARLFRRYGEEHSARRIAEAIEEHRYAIGPLRRTSELARLVESIIGFGYRKDKLGRSAHVATRVFQALRIFVNDELNELWRGLQSAYRLLRPGGRLVVLTFHSLEDRLVKQIFTNKDAATRTVPVVLRGSKKAFGHRYRLRHLSDDEVLQPTTEYEPPRQRCQVKDDLSQTVVCWQMVTDFASPSNDFVVASNEEVIANPRARSAKLRAAIRLADSIVQ